MVWTQPIDNRTINEKNPKNTLERAILRACCTRQARRIKKSLKRCINKHLKNSTGRPGPRAARGQRRGAAAARAAGVALLHRGTYFCFSLFCVFNCCSAFSFAARAVGVAPFHRCAHFFKLLSVFHIFFTSFSSFVRVFDRGRCPSHWCGATSPRQVLVFCFTFFSSSLLFRILSCCPSRSRGASSPRHLLVFLFVCFFPLFLVL